MCLLTGFVMDYARYAFLEMFYVHFVCFAGWLEIGKLTHSKRIKSNSLSNATTV